MQDLTPLIKASLNISEACVYNPSFVLLNQTGLGQHGNLMLLSIRIYWSIDHDTPCVEPGKPGGQWAEWWKGRQGYALLIIDLGDTTASSAAAVPGAGGGHQKTVLNHILLSEDNLEDPRLFRDDQGKIRSVLNEQRGAGIMMGRHWK